MNTRPLTAIDFVIEPSAMHDGDIRVPGDKSISHRALLLGSVAEGTSTVRGFLESADCLATRRALETLGVQIEDLQPGVIAIHGKGFGSLGGSSAPLDLGNSGTGLRLLAGLLVGQGIEATLTGDASLRARPMGRILEPLRAMGARLESTSGHAPLTIGKSPDLHGVSWVLPMASAQVKSAILLAGLGATGATMVTEPSPTRDHTERMLAQMGVAIRNESGTVTMLPVPKLRSMDLTVPGDLSSAAFLIVAALVAEDIELRIRDVGINPTRTGILTILAQMGADIEVCNERKYGEEPVADIRVRSSKLRGIEVDPQLVSLAIDEFPVLFVAAACASGQTVFSGLQELRVKESDRIETMAEGLAALGIEVQKTTDGAIISGGPISGGEVNSLGDHRVAMAFAVLGSRIESPLRIRDVANVATSFPGFAGLCANLGLQVRESGDG